MTQHLQPNEAALSLLELLARISREMDRFPIVLKQVEAEVSKIILQNPASITKETNTSLQSIDYIAQVSVAISDLITRATETPDGDMTDLVTKVVPGDLSCRLRDTGLEDIDNTARKIEFF